ncbi:response regulator [Flavisolibacter nicotianae]|uniref:response regulator n=1 Tax=Flavisolibacter nicotianae TaxID=2364882 RepID=UPI000EAFEC61|nr:response regulator [Flavisolibacter nicotianae]
MRSKQYDILVVDDDEEDRLMMGEVFAELNCADQVTMYENGLSFHKDLVQLRTLTPLPLMVVLDYYLGDADGGTELSLLKSDPVLFSVPVVMYSAGMSSNQKQDCVSKGAARCFEKGSTYGELRSFCKQVRDLAFDVNKCH